MPAKTSRTSQTLIDVAQATMKADGVSAPPKGEFRESLKKQHPEFSVSLNAWRSMAEFRASLKGWKSAMDFLKSLKGVEISHGVRNDTS